MLKEIMREPTLSLLIPSVCNTVGLRVTLAAAVVVTLAINYRNCVAR